MHRQLGSYSPFFYALLRIFAGLMMACHGGQKVLGLFGGMPPSGGSVPAFTLFWFVGMLELIGGLLVAVGLFASWAAFLLSGLMAFAYFMAHFPQGLIPLVNKGELAVVYCFVFLYIASRGSGTLSIDEARAR